MEKHNKISNERYNALVHNFALVKAALDKCSVEVAFYDDAAIFLYELSTRRARENGFDFDRFWDDVKSCKFFPEQIYHQEVDGQSCFGDRFSPVLAELVRAFKNRAPSLGEKFERVVKTNDSVASTAVGFLIAEYLYLDRSITHVEREIKNEAFRLAMFNAHAEPLYIAALNVIRSYAASMARDVLAADVEAAIGGENNAD